MQKLFKPTWLMTTYTDITPTFLKEKNITTVFTDLDNTLVAWDERNADEVLKAWIDQLRAANITVVLVSNNNAERIKIVADQLEVPFVYPALKPLHKGLRAAQKLVNSDNNETVMIGDQAMTDILAASTFGIRTILVRPLKTSDGWNTRINRFFERLILKRVLTPAQLQQWGNSDES